MSRVVFFDFDATVVTKESLDEIIAYALSEHPEKEKLIHEVETITKRGMNGEIPFTQSATLRLGVVPLNRTQLVHVGHMLTQHITPGMTELFSWLTGHGVDIYIVSGGFAEAILPTALHIGVPQERVFTNRCIYTEDGTVQGTDHTSYLWTNDGKAPVIRHILSAYHSPTSALIGDGANDLAAYTQGAVQHFCGFGAHVERPKVKAEAPAFVYNTADAQEWLAKVLSL